MKQERENYMGGSMLMPREKANFGLFAQKLLRGTKGDKAAKEKAKEAEESFLRGSAKDEYDEMFTPQGEMNEITGYATELSTYAEKGQPVLSLPNYLKGNDVLLTTAYEATADAPTETGFKKFVEKNYREYEDFRIAQVAQITRLAKELGRDKKEITKLTESNDPFQVIMDLMEETVNKEDSERLLSQESLKRSGKAKGGKFPDLNKDGKTTYADVLKGRGAFQEGGESMLMPTERMPVDTYDNIPPEEMAAAEASQLPDSEMENSYIDFVLTEALTPEDQKYLTDALETDERLSGIFDQIMDVAGEFSGEGEVDGPGTGVSDSIPARLSDGEFVITKKATDQIGADNLQKMMDDAERAYDGGQMQKMAFGGLTNDPMQDEKQSDYMQGIQNTEEEIKRQMIRSNRTPSVYQNLR